MSFIHLIRTTVLLGICLLLGTSSLVSAAPGQFQWASLDQRLSSLSFSSNFLVSEIRGSTCKTIHGRDQDRQLAIASTFKIYVLGELARQIQLGEASWDEEIALTEHLRSMPSGDYAFVPIGTRVTLQDLAKAMIWQSDNTATDHLINRLGRENVQKAFQAYGHGNPTLNAPLLLTKEMFGIKMSQSPEWIAAWQSSPEDVQLTMLVETIDPIVINPSGGWGNWNGPTAIDSIEWFASAEDLCRATASLWSMGAQPGLEQVRAILAGNRYGITDTSTWPHAGYKGGYEAGVVNMTFVLERSDGRVFFVSAGYNDPVRVVDTATARMHIEPVFTCLGTYVDGNDCAG